jgi:3'-phosphoadenosine 5'-phosphosulfate sulfotransferase (PAPS reductase)/FAD synthetase
VEIRPHVPSKNGTPYERKTYLEKLLPLEDYHMIVVLTSGGKDSAAAFLHLLELGVPKDKIELWHHDVDGQNPDRKMDWPVTQAYIKAFAKIFEVKLRTSWRVNGFFGELYRIGASYPIEYEDDGQVITCPLSPKQLESERLREEILAGSVDKAALKQYGYRMKFPAKSGDLVRRWCSAYLKICVADTVVRNIDLLKTIGRVEQFPGKGSIAVGRWCSPELKRKVGDSVIRNLNALQTKGYAQDVKLLIVSGERRSESAGRSKYNEMELHRLNATAKAHRHVHLWRPVIEWSERDVWEALRRHSVVPHPCYMAGWNRCSCAMCIFGLPQHWAGIRELFPSRYAEIRRDEEILHFTIDNSKNLDEYVGGAQSCVNHDSPKAVRQLITGTFTVNDILVLDSSLWRFPAGAFHGQAGGPC